jgi:crotonobetainyl-CoA:carnitine CoA-transferase CaiB-like acyl-CoA transferase
MTFAPLSGVSVAEFTGIVAGLAAGMLAALGAS